MIEQRSFALLSYALFAAMLGVAGLPIYIHAPKFFVDTYEVSLSKKFWGVDVNWKTCNAQHSSKEGIG